MHYTVHGYGRAKKQSFIRRNRLQVMAVAVVGALALTAGVGTWAAQGNSSGELAHRWGFRRQNDQKSRAKLAHKKSYTRNILRKITVKHPGAPVTNPVPPVVTDPVIPQPTTPIPDQNTAINPSPIALLSDDIDHREYMHGIDFVRLGGRDMLVWASNGYVPTSPKGEWMHDIFYSYVDPADPRGTFSAKTLVSARMAQEPASSAVNSNGRLMVTAEDAQFSDYLDQTYGLWDASLKPTTAYGAKLMPPQGGHSGHVAASGDKFLVSFSDGWIDGGGVNNMGTGDDVFAKIVNEDGATGSMIKTAVGSSRDWWPIVAGSDAGWLQVWQRYGTAGTGGGTVMGAVIDPSGKIVKELPIFTNNKYYYHDVQYIPALGLYLVTGSQNTAGNSGVAVLIDKAGNIVATKTGLPATNRESQAVISEDGKTAVYPVPGVGAAVLDLTSTSVALRKTVAINWNWDYMGTDGIFTGASRVVFATGTQQGVKFITVEF